ncbi:MAG: hypothetical protein EOO20_02850 [Chryseobacterium sp.]|nr:MAG: hypothetical protein EOO20_02850 [Chryseobacterium sp.]
MTESIREYFLKEVSDDPELESIIEKFLSEFKSGLSFLIEYPYVDKVYRDSYYTYYASKHSRYQRDCIRISIFNNEINFVDFTDPVKHSKLQDIFLGYFVLRPQRTMIGHSLINPAAFLNKNIKICLHKAESLVLGVKLTAEGFPHSAQDGETISCAETTIWATMQYFGMRYAEYKPVLPSTITKVIERIAVQRLLPSNGLTMDQISFALKQFGFGTRIYSREHFGDEFFEIIDAYIESGIPVLTGLESASGGLGHVVVMIGKKYNAFDYKNLRPKVTIGPRKKYYDISQFNHHYVIQDDNLSPYQVISLDSPGINYDDSDSKNYQIDTIVVPLYSKIYLEAFVAKRLFVQIIKDGSLGFDFKNKSVLRCFLSSSRSFKSHITKLTDMDSEVKSIILLSKMPKFIWVGEVYEQDQYIPFVGKPQGLVILDATENSSTNTDALIFAGYPDRFVTINENKFIILQQKLSNYSYYSNLK